MHAQNEKIAASLAQRQLDAYNARDLERFVACYAADVEVRDQSTGALTLQGHAAMRERYGPMFRDHPQLHCQVVSRIVMGRFVFDEERVTGRGDAALRVVAIYEINDEAIAKVWFARPD